jgi:8-oxo-dGTP diphosphatase
VDLRPVVRIRKDQCGVPHLTPASGRRFLHIAAGAIRRPSGEVLICQRPAHKIYPGEWEFPGGKVEPGETVEQALARELQEELGIRVTAARPLIRLRHVYPELSVDLDTWLVTGFEGEPVSNEHPASEWVLPADMQKWTLLAADAPIVNALRLPSNLVFTPPDFEAQLACATWPDSLLRLRLPHANDTVYRATAKLLCEEGVRPFLDRDPADVARFDAAGFHATDAALRALTARPVAKEKWFGASVHDADGLARALACGADYAVLGPVRPTRSHPGAPALGWETFASLATGAGLPVYAIGGLTPEDLPVAWSRGAQGVAGISAYWD